MENDLIHADWPRRPEWGQTGTDKESIYRLFPRLALLPAQAAAWDTEI